MAKVLIKVNHGIAGHEAGEVVKVDARENGQPDSQFWRRRLRDAEHDGCCEIVNEQKAVSDYDDVAAMDGGEE